MIKKYLLLIAISAFVCFSCTNEEDVVSSDIQQMNDFELVNLNDFADTNSTLRSAIKQDRPDQIVLRFKDEASYEKTRGKLQGMSKKERLAWSTTLAGFNSLQEINDTCFDSKTFIL